MQRAKSTVSRIEFRTNLTRADAEVITLGFIVESLWDDARWMGMIFRPAITPNELREINVATWPEMAAPGDYLKTVFREGWNAEDGCAAQSLSKKFGSLSAFHVFLEDADSNFADGLASATDADVQKELVARLHQYQDCLKPAHAAKMYRLPHKNEPRVDAFVTPSRRAG